MKTSNVQTRIIFYNMPANKRSNGSYDNKLRRLWLTNNNRSRKGSYTLETLKLQFM